MYSALALARDPRLLSFFFLMFSITIFAQEPEDPRRPPAITTKNVPNIPAELAERLRQYLEVRAAAFQGWSPDGQGILISTRFGATVQLHRVLVPGGRREQVTFFAEPVAGRFVPAATDGRLLLSMAQGGDENYQISLLDRQTGKARLLTDGRARNLLGPVRRDGKQLIFVSNRRNGTDSDLYRLSLDPPGAAELFWEVKSEFWSPSDLSPDGTKLLANRVVSINESYPVLYDFATKSRKSLPIPAKGKSASGNLRFSADGLQVYLTTDARGEFHELARLDLATEQLTWHSSDLAWDVDGIEVCPLTGQVAFTVNADGASELYLLRKDERQKVELPLGILGGLEFSPDGKRLGFTLARPEAPTDAYSLDLATRELTRWTFSEVGGLNPATFRGPQRIQFPTFDGRQIPAYYYAPAGASRERPAAVLIHIHGGPEGQTRPAFSGFTQFLLQELGIAVLEPNVRGSEGYGKTYLQLDNGPLRENSVRDIGALLDWVGRKPELDGSRVGVMGASYGGYMVLATLVNYPERLRAGVDIVGIANFITFLENTSPYRRDLRRVEYGDERDPAMRAVFEKINPAARAERIRSALLVAHGKNDPRVPFSEAEQIAARVQGRVWTVFADNEGHGFSRKENRDYFNGVLARFLQENLLPLEKK